jgi:chromate transporter
MANREQSTAPNGTTGGGPTATVGRGSVLEVARVATKLGLTSFGGPVAHLGYFRREYVERRGWLDERTYADLVALCQFLPGPASSQLGIAIGTIRAGARGGIAAWLGFTLPSAIAMILFGIYAGTSDLSGAGWLHGLKLAAVAVVAQAVVLMALRLTPDWPRRVLAIVAAAVALSWTTPFAQVAIIVGGAIAGLLLLRPATSGHAHAMPSIAISPRYGALALGVFAVLLVVLSVAGGVGGPVALFGSFFRSGALVFGGGHVVLPLLHASVVDPGWVGNDRFLAGYGAAQAVPGPLFTFAGYLGAVSVVPPATGAGGAVGGVVAVAGIFLPSFLLIFGTLPFWGRLRASRRFGRALAGTNAAVVGLLAAALYTPVWTGAVVDLADVAVVIVGLGVLATRRVPPIVIVVGCAVAGQALGG